MLGTEVLLTQSHLSSPYILMLICACNYRMHLICSCARSSTCGYASRVQAVSLHTCVPLSSDSSEPPVRHSLLADTEMKPPVWHSQFANTEMKPPERHSLLVDTKMKPPELHSLLVDMKMKPEEPSETMCGVVNLALLGIIQLGDFTANPLISRFFICQSLPLETLSRIPQNNHCKAFGLGLAHSKPLEQVSLCPVRQGPKTASQKVQVGRAACSWVD